MTLQQLISKQSLPLTHYSSPKVRSGRVENDLSASTLRPSLSSLDPAAFDPSQTDQTWDGLVYPSDPPGRDNGATLAVPLTRVDKKVLMKRCNLDASSP